MITPITPPSLFQISGYFQWLTMIQMKVAEDGHSLRALLTFLGE